MSIIEKVLAELIDIIEWSDDSTDTLVWKFPRFDNEIKHGAQLIVRQSQEAVFVNEGVIADCFKSGRHKLITENLPVLTTLLGWKYGFHSPFKAEVFFVNTRNFTDCKWGTQNPVIVRDPEFGPVRLRSYGSYVMRVANPSVFVKEIVGTNSRFTVDGITSQLRNLIVTRFADMVASSGIPVPDLSANYTELSEKLAQTVAAEFSEYGLDVTKLLIENISLPTEVEAALDKKSSMGVIGNLDNYMKFQSANAMEQAAINSGGDASAGVGMGIGFAMAEQIGRAMAPKKGDDAPPPLPDDHKYYLGVDGKRQGPFTKSEITERVNRFEINSKTLIWRQGYEGWVELETSPDFSGTLPPPLPKGN